MTFHIEPFQADQVDEILAISQRAWTPVFKDDVTYDIVRSPEPAKEDGYWLVNAQVGLASGTDSWDIRIWARNLLDEEYRSQVLTSTVGFGETWGMPRTYGMTLSYVFTQN